MGGEEGTNQNAATYLAQNFVPFLADKIAHLVEMHVPKTTPTVEFGADLASDLYDRPKHLIVAIASEENLACI